MGKIANDLTSKFEFSVSQDFTVHANGDASPEQDFFQFFIQGPWSSRSTINVMFITSTGDSTTNSYETLIDVKSKKTAKKAGLGKIADVSDHLEDLLDRSKFNTLSEKQQINDTISEKLWLIDNDNWQLLSIPKTTFQKNGAGDWSDINQLQFVFSEVHVGSIEISGINMVGGGKDNAGAVTPVGGSNGNAGNGGLQGTYKYRLTYKNSTTGNRSNPCEVVQVAEEVNRGYVQLTDLPVSSDAQVDIIEIWRTIGDGTRYFKIAEVANDTGSPVLTFDDEVSDHDVLDDTEGVATMQNIELPIDNDVPFSTFDDVIIDKLAAFWLDPSLGRAGRVYFSPLGRPEGMKGFINVSQAGDPLQKLVLHKGQRYVFSESKCFRVDGEDPYVGREIGGVPGLKSTQKRTAVSTPIGILYQAADGVRLFDGTSARLVTPDSMSKLFRGEASENMTAFEGTLATFARDEYIISDGTQTLAFNVNNASWREVGFNDVTALFYEWDTDVILAGRTSETQLIEVEGVFQDYNAADIAFEWETPAVNFPDDQVMVVRFAYIDIDTQGETVTPTLVHRYGTVAMTDISSATRTTVERELEQSFVKPSLRFAGTVGAQVTLYNAELDIRELELGVTNIKTGQRLTQPGRIFEDATRIAFDVVSAIPALSAQVNIPIYTQMHLDINTNGEDVDVKLIGATETIQLATINTSTRETVLFDINRVGSLRNVHLTGDFTTDISVFGVELTMRPLPLGINIVGN